MREEQDLHALRELGQDRKRHAGALVVPLD
jgi:hypothetical protein